MGGGKGGSKAPPQIDQGKSMGEYLFGAGSGGFTAYQGITDPRLQERLISAERTYRPQYTALELADIGVMARGIEAGAPNPEYARLEAELAGLRAGAEYSSMGSAERNAALEDAAARLYPDNTPRNIGSIGGAGGIKWGFNEMFGKSGPHPDVVAKREAYIKAAGGGGDTAGRIAQIEAQLEGMSPTLEATPGLFDLLEEQSTRAGALQREQLGLQRESDVAALEEFAPQVVEAYRAADPYSTGLAEQATDRAQLQAASAAEQQLQAMGMSLSDLSPTEQEALLSQRGMEFAASTGELTPLEQRRAQQSARQASVSRGREMDQSALYGEMQSRMSQEMDKQGREIAMGSQLLGQQAGLRGSRLGQGAGMLTSSEALAAQRRSEYGQNLQQAFGMNRQLAGDVGMTILGRPSQSIGLGSQVLGQAQQGAAGPMGPQLFDPNAGINMALQQRGQDITFQGMQAQANAAKSAGLMSGIGSIAGGMIAGPAGAAVGGAAGGAACWVAREVYGIESGKWLQFREWMLDDSPSWFRKLYLKYGERFAKFISNKPRIKSIIRNWMNTKIK